MPSITTIYRAVVMVVAGVIVVKGWQLYGPSNEQVKALATRALEVAQTALNSGQSNSAGASTADPRLAAAPPSASPTPTASAPPPLFAADPNATKIGTTHTPAEPAGAPSDVAPPATMAQDQATAPAGGSDTDRMPLLLARLEELGAADHVLAAWGSGGQMYRFCCRAALFDSPTFARHFEAVAAEPLAAVEQVVAKVEAWRTDQRERTALR